MLVPQRRRRSATSSDSKSHDANKRQAADVHAQLGAHLDAYAVFRPAPPSDLPLFQVALVLSSPESRALSPRGTSANLQTIFSHLQPSVSSRDPDSDDGVQALLSEFAKLSAPSQLDSPRQNVSALTVSEASLNRAGANVSSGISRRHSTVRQIMMSDVCSEGYTGGNGLHELIWNKGHIVFGKVLLEIDMNLGTGDRHLIAIVTKRFQGSISVSKSPLSTKPLCARASSDGIQNIPSCIAFDPKVVADSASCDAYSGICGVHLLVFPVEVLGPLKWRVYRGIDVEDSGALNDSEQRFAQAQQWHRKHGNTPYPTDRYKHNANNHRAIERLQCEASGADSEPGSIITTTDDTSNQNDVNKSGEDRTRSNKSVPSDLWIDIDFSESLAEFTLLQCDLAILYRASGVQQQYAHSVTLLRSALRKCCPESVTRALVEICECYEQGLGVKKCESDAEKLRFCLQMWEEGRQCAVSLEALRTDRKFSESKEPERRILQLMKESGLHRGVKRGRIGSCVKDEMSAQELWKRIKVFQEVLNDTAARMADLERMIVASNPLTDLQLVDLDDPDSEAFAGMNELYRRQSQFDPLLGVIGQDASDEEQEEYPWRRGEACNNT